MCREFLKKKSGLNLTYPVYTVAAVGSHSNINDLCTVESNAVCRAKAFRFLLRGEMFAHPLATDLTNAFDHSKRMALYCREK